MLSIIDWILTKKQKDLEDMSQQELIDCINEYEDYQDVISTDADGF